MIKEELHDLNLTPFTLEGYELALKNFVLFSQYKNNTIIAVSSLHLEIALDYLSKYEYSYEVKFLDGMSYEKLFSKLLIFELINKCPRFKKNKKTLKYKRMILH